MGLQTDWDGREMNANEVLADMVKNTYHWDGASGSLAGFLLRYREMAKAALGCVDNDEKLGAIDDDFVKEFECDPFTDLQRDTRKILGKATDQEKKSQ